MRVLDYHTPDAPHGHQLGRMAWSVLPQVACFIAFVKTYTELDGTEFREGRLTGRLLGCLGAAIIFLMGSICAGMLNRWAGALFNLGACLLAFPIYLVLIAPRLSHRLFGGVWSTQSPVFYWDSWSVLAVVILLVAAWVSTKRLRKLGRSSIPN